MKRVKSLLAFVVSLLTIVNCTIPANCEVSNVEESEVIKETVSNELYNWLLISNDEDVLCVYLWLKDIDMEELESTTYQKCALSEDSFTSTENDIYGDFDFDSARLDAEYLKSFYENKNTEIRNLSTEVDYYLSERRAVSAELYSAKNERFVKNHIDDEKIVFCSKYAPMLICNLSKTEIIDLCYDEEVESMSVFHDCEAEDEGSIYIGVVGVDGVYTKSSMGADGTDVIIGQIEKGRPETNVPELASITIVRAGDSYNTTHASLVASIMAGSGGMAPQAKLYCTTITNTTVFYSHVEWLITSGVNIINMSAKLGTSSSYDDVAKWVDHVSYMHKITFVKSSGNEAYDYVPIPGYVTSPGHAYNVITVSGIELNNTVDKTDDFYFIGSKYTIGTAMPLKPDVAAPAGKHDFSGGNNMIGTSFAAPFVSGAIAQMMTYCPSLKLRPDSIKAALMAGCDRKTTGETMYSLTNKEGAGVINSYNAIMEAVEIISNNTKYYFNPSTNTNVVARYFTAEEDGEMVVTIAWLKNSIASGTDHMTITDQSLTNYDLKIYTMSGTFIVSSISSVNNVEYVRFNVEEDETYKIKIVRPNGSTIYDYLSLAYWY